MATVIDAALRWASAGRPVFPATRDKRPMTERGFHDATTDLELIERFWRRHPDANVAVPTGQPSGLVVLDVDGQDGADSLHGLEHDHGKLPPTTSVVTPRGGQHFYFAWPGMPVKTTASAIAPAIDIRGDGGYVLIPPSRTDHGAYEWDVELQPVSMPAWLIDLTCADSQRESPARVPDEWAALIRDGIPDGRRNVDLARFTGYLLRHYIAADVTAELVHLVNEHRCQPPKPPAEVETIINSVARAELHRRERK